MPDFWMSERDLEEIAQELKGEGYLWAQASDGPTGIVAVVCQKLMDRVSHLKDRREKEVQLFMGVSGIIQWAVDDGLIDEER